MSDLTDLITWRDALEKARFSGIRTLREGDKMVTYGDDAEMRNAVADVSRKIAQLQGTGPLREVQINSSKGL